MTTATNDLAATAATRAIAAEAETRAAAAESAINAAVAEALGETWLTREEMAQRYKVPTKTLAQWGSQQKGPPFTKIGRWCRYRLADAIAWENRQATGGDVA